MQHCCHRRFSKFSSFSINIETLFLALTAELCGHLFGAFICWDISARQQQECNLLSITHFKSLVFPLYSGNVTANHMEIISSLLYEKM